MSTINNVIHTAVAHLDARRVRSGSYCLFEYRTANGNTLVVYEDDMYVLGQRLIDAGAGTGELCPDAAARIVRAWEPGC